MASPTLEYLREKVDNLALQVNSANNMARKYQEFSKIATEKLTLKDMELTRVEEDVFVLKREIQGLKNLLCQVRFLLCCVLVILLVI
jgi:hypothetical protein